MISRKSQQKEAEAINEEIRQAPQYGEQQCKQ